MEYTVEEYNKKKELAESGNLDAICDLGYLYYYGFGNTAPDIDKGVYYWCTAANLGNAVAQDARRKFMSNSISFNSIIQHNEMIRKRNICCIYYETNLCACTM